LVKHSREGLKEGLIRFRKTTFATQRRSRKKWNFLAPGAVLVEDFFVNGGRTLYPSPLREKMARSAG
jgi:hypothetical protein